MRAEGGSNAGEAAVVYRGPEPSPRSRPAPLADALDRLGPVSRPLTDETVERRNPTPFFTKELVSLRSPVPMVLALQLSVPAALLALLLLAGSPPGGRPNGR